MAKEQKTVTLPIRFDKYHYQMLREVADLETINSGQEITVAFLIREAVKWVYAENERLREIFRKHRELKQWVKPKKVVKNKKKI